MKIVSLVSWAGHDFSCAPGDAIDVSDAVGDARIAAGLALSVEPESEPEPTRKRGAK